MFYEFRYQSNVVEQLLLECTGTRRVSYKFADATADIAVSYEWQILGLTEIAPDLFTGKPLSRRLWDEVSLWFTRDYTISETDRGVAAEPILMAQKDVVRMMSEFHEEKNVICDYVFWEEVLHFEGATSRLLADAKTRKRTALQHADFDKKVKEGLVVLDKLFEANPLKAH